MKNTAVIPAMFAMALTAGAPSTLLAELNTNTSLANDRKTGCEQRFTCLPVGLFSASFVNQMTDTGFIHTAGPNTGYFDMPGNEFTVAVSRGNGKKKVYAVNVKKKERP